VILVGHRGRGVVIFTEGGIGSKVARPGLRSRPRGPDEGGGVGGERGKGVSRPGRRSAGGKIVEQGTVHGKRCPRKTFTEIRVGPPARDGACGLG